MALPVPLPTESEVLDAFDKLSSNDLGVFYVALRNVLVADEFDILDAGQAIQAAINDGALVANQGRLHRAS